MSAYWRLLGSLLRGMRRSYILWQMNEASRSGRPLYSCVSCGMARTEPCEHWLHMLPEDGEPEPSAERKP